MSYINRFINCLSVKFLFVFALSAFIMPAAFPIISCAVVFAGEKITGAEAENYMQKQDYAKAADLYSQLISGDTDNVHLMFNYGTSLSFINEQTKAVEIFKKCAATLEKKLALIHETSESELLAHVYNNLSKCHIGAGEYDEAINACENGLRRFNNLSWLYYNLGEAQLLKNDVKKALVNFQRAVALDPADISANLKIVECHYAMRNYDEAGRMLGELMKFYPENSEILFNLGSVYYKQEKINEAVKIWKNIAEREPDSKFGKISRQWLSELKIEVDPASKLMAETIECKLMGFLFVKPQNFYMAKYSESVDNSLYMLAAHIYDDTAKNTAEISLSISAQILSEPQDYKKFAVNWQKNQAANGSGYELLSEKEMTAGLKSKPARIWEYGAVYNGVAIKGATMAFINKNYAVLIWLNATPATFAKAIDDFYLLAKSFDDIR